MIRIGAAPREPIVLNNVNHCLDQRKMERNLFSKIEPLQKVLQRNVYKFLLELVVLSVSFEGGLNIINKVALDHEEYPLNEYFGQMGNFDVLLRKLSKCIKSDIIDTVNQDLKRHDVNFFDCADASVNDYVTQNIIIKYGFHMAYHLDNTEESEISRKFFNMVLKPYINSYVPLVAKPSHLNNFTVLHVDEDENVFVENDEFEAKIAEILEIDVSEERKESYLTLQRFITDMVLETVTLYDQDNLFNSVGYEYENGDESLFGYIVRKNGSITDAIGLMVPYFEEKMYEMYNDDYDPEDEEHLDEINARLYGYFEDVLKYFGLKGIRTLDSDSFFREKVEGDLYNTYTSFIN